MDFYSQRSVRIQVRPHFLLSSNTPTVFREKVTPLKAQPLEMKKRGTGKFNEKEAYRY